MRFVNNNITLEAARNPYAYVKGTDFNSQQKYDYNIVNGVPLAGNAAIGKGGNLGMVGGQSGQYHTLNPNASSPKLSLQNAGAHILNK